MYCPKFFTPNGDRINDNYNIENLEAYKDAVVTIFDRTGNFVKKIKPSGEGWNGISKNSTNGAASSYWFKVEYMYDGEINRYTSCFSLLRQ
ncbi:MAG: gliding motility-associated-like protein [Flavobacterium sp.]|jgi:gliding motility-associated-like protein